MTRPYKGDRVSLTTKVPRAYYEKLDRLSRVRGQTKVDYIANLITRDLDQIDVEAEEGQESFPLTA